VSDNEAWARFLRTLAAAANQLAADLTATPVEESLADSEAGASPERLVIGKRQQAIVTIPGLREEEGMKTAAIARMIGSSDVPNVYLAMRALEKRGLVELVPNRHPQHWRRVAHYRGAALLPGTS
jgi:hypothetical protein